MDLISRQLVKRRDEGFRCPVCEKYFALTNSYCQHLARKGLSVTIPPVTQKNNQENAKDSVSPTLSWILAVHCSLVTSSMRLDKESVKLGPSTTHFSPSEKTRVFADLESIHSVKSMLSNKRHASTQDMPLLYQMRQLRSKFHSLSTYTKCRASASIASRLELQPSTI